MVNVIRLTNASDVYFHSLQEPGEREFDAILGGAGNDFIVGDNETWDIYPPDWGADWDYEMNGVLYLKQHGPDDRPTWDNAEDYFDDYYTGRGVVFFSPHWVYEKKESNRNDSIAIDEYLDGGDGNDSVFGRGGNDWIVGDEGNDILVGGTGNDIIKGDKGNDTINNQDGEYDVAIGGHGDDVITMDLNDYADGGLGMFDRIAIGNIDGPSTFDFLVAENVIDFEYLEFNGGHSSDTVRGGMREDKLVGNGGDDWLEGRRGDDTIYGGAGLDVIYGGSGNDEIRGGTETDIIYDDAGEDTVYGDEGDDLIWTGEGNDTVYGGAGNDFIGESGEDGMPSNRTNANDIILGEAGRDTIFAGTGDDVINGGADQDLIVGGLGIDHLIGGTETDTFCFRVEDISRIKVSDGTEQLFSLDRITDFSIKDHDLIDLRDLRSLVPDGKLFYDGNSDGVQQAGEIILVNNAGMMQLVVDLDGNGDSDLTIDFEGLAYSDEALYAAPEFLVLA